MPVTGYFAKTTLNPNPVQPASALLGIHILMGLVTLIPLVIGLLILSKYPLVGNTLAKLKKDIEVLHKKKAERLAKT